MALYWNESPPRQHHADLVLLYVFLHGIGNIALLVVHVNRIDIQLCRLLAGGYIRDPKREMIPCADRIDKTRHDKQII